MMEILIPKKTMPTFTAIILMKKIGQKNVIVNVFNGTYFCKQMYYHQQCTFSTFSKNVLVKKQVSTQMEDIPI